MQEVFLWKWVLYKHTFLCWYVWIFYMPCVTDGQSTPLPVPIHRWHQDPTLQLYSLKLLLLRQRALWRFRPDNLLVLSTAVSISVVTRLPIWTPLHWSIIKHAKSSSNNATWSEKGSDGGFLRLQPPQRLTDTHDLGLPLIFTFHLSLLPSL